MQNVRQRADCWPSTPREPDHLRGACAKWPNYTSLVMFIASLFRSKVDVIWACVKFWEALTDKRRDVRQSCDANLAKSIQAARIRCSFFFFFPSQSCFTKILLISFSAPSQALGWIQLFLASAASSNSSAKAERVFWTLARLTGMHFKPCFTCNSTTIAYWGAGTGMKWRQRQEQICFHMAVCFGKRVTWITRHLEKFAVGKILSPD